MTQITVKDHRREAFLVREGPEQSLIRWADSKVEQVLATEHRCHRGPETGRLCAICGKRTSPKGRKDTYGYRTILSRNGIAGDKAHPDCVRSLKQVT